MPPAEGATYRFAKEDRRRFPGIRQAGTDARPYYTNSSQLPVGFTDDPFEALGRQEELQGRYTGGTVLHLYMNERISSASACRELVRRALTRFDPRENRRRLPHILLILRIGADAFPILGAEDHHLGSIGRRKMLGLIIHRAVPQS